jgi:hypothetical protein
MDFPELALEEQPTNRNKDAMTKIDKNLLRVVVMLTFLLDFDMPLAFISKSHLPLASVLNLFLPPTHPYLL